LQRGHVLAIAKNELAQLAAGRSGLLRFGTGVLVMLAYAVASVVVPLHKDVYSAPEFLASMAQRLPSCDRMTLLRFVAADRALPMVLALWPALAGILTTTSLTEEKERRTLESLLLLPVSAKEILVGKAASIGMSAVVGSWFIYGCTVLASGLLVSSQLARYLVNARLLALSFLSLPALALLSTMAGIAISSSVADSRTAISLQWLVIIPGMAGFALLSFTSIAPSVTFAVLVALVLGGAGIVLTGLAAVLFQREKLLLRFR